MRAGVFCAVAVCGHSNKLLQVAISLNDPSISGLKGPQTAGAELRIDTGPLHESRRQKGHAA
jgi:hypothetical protein